MRKNVALSLALLLVLLPANLLFAAGQSSKYHRMQGDITSVDASANTITVKHGKETSTFVTNYSTKYRGAGKEISFGDLLVGDYVRVSFIEEGGEKVAARIEVTPCKSRPGLPQCHPKK